MQKQKDRFTRSVKLIIIIILLSLCFVEGFSTDCFIPALPAITKYFNIRVGIAQLAISVYFLGYFILVPYGFLSDYYGRKKILLVSYAIFIAGGLFCVFSENYITFLVGRFLQGMGICTVTMNRAIFCDIFSNEKLKSLYSYLRGILIICGALAPLFGGYLTHYLGWRSIFVVILCMGIVLFMIILLLYPETLQANSHSKVSLNAFIFKIKNILKNMQFLIPVFCNMFCYSGIYIIFAISPFFFQNTLKWSSIKYGYFAFSIPMIIALGSMLNNFLLKKMKEIKIINRVMLLGLILSLVLIINCIVIKNTSVIVLVLLGFSLLTGMVIPNTFLSALNFINKDNDAGVSFTMFSFIRIIGTSLIIFGISFLHAKTALIIGALLFFISLLIVILSSFIEIIGKKEVI